MQSRELRQRFLSFFAARGHTIVPSDSLVPSGDPTVLFTSAGMNQFKPYFLGLKTDLRRAASCQKCLRTGDLEQVGRTASHHSFFEMLGNFSFGDYFKAEAIQWAWEFLTGTLDYAGRMSSPDRGRLCLGLAADKLWVSVYEEDDEAAALWAKLGVPSTRIKRLGQAENFWPANAPTQGPNGPCGPCSEIYYDAEGQVDSPTSVEIWNLVFTQYDRQPDGTLKSLPKPNIDTGMGLERLAAVVQHASDDYKTDLFQPIIGAIEKLPRGQQGTALPERARAAIADHMRAVVLLISEGLLPSNEGRGYVLRMLIRRAHRLGRWGLGIGSDSSPFLCRLVEVVEEGFAGSPYSDELARRRSVIQRAIEQEERQFAETLEAGMQRLMGNVLVRYEHQRVVPGDEAFRLYDTYGFPLELTVDVASEHGFEVDREGFTAALGVQQARSRAGSQFTGEVFVADDLKVRRAIADLPEKDAQFIGYEQLEADSVIQGLWDGRGWVNEIQQGQTAGIVLEHSPFYGESGGQIGDTGTIENAKGGAADVAQTTWVDDVLVHHAKIRQGRLKVQEPVRARVDRNRRLQVARSHTATHMLHWALRKVLGPEAVQAGSAVEPDQLRFDVASLQPLGEEQRAEVETLVNTRVGLADPVSTSQMKLEEAKRTGAMAMFGEKYGDRVRVVAIGDYSKELCGGTHLPHTGLVGIFTIVTESSIAAGTRRIEAVVGQAAQVRHRDDVRLLQAASHTLGQSGDQLLDGFRTLLERFERAKRETKVQLQVSARVEASRLVAQVKDIGGIAFIAAYVKQADRAMLAMMADTIKASLPKEGAVLLASEDGGQVSFVAATSAGIAKRLPAGELIKVIAPLVQGSGGGRPEFAQGGGKDPAGIPAALARAEAWVREVVGR